MDLLYSLSLRGVGDDQIVWRRESQKGFTVKCYYQCLSPPSLRTFPWKNIWKVKVPPRVAFFSWTAALWKIFTIENLQNVILSLRIGVVCVSGVVRVMIIYCCIAWWLVSYGLWFLACLGSRGCCQVECWIFGLVGLVVLVGMGIGMWLFGGLFLIVWCGVFGGRGTRVILRIVS